MAKYTDLAVLMASGFALMWFLRTAWRGRNKRTDVSPVSEQWLAEKRAKQD
jgi:hypothetical protein